MSAQGLAVELSIHWKKTEVHLDVPHLNPDTAVSIPYFKITYRNLSGQNIYLKKIYRPLDQYPPVIIASLINTSMDMAERIKSNPSYSGESFIVEVGEAWTTYTEDTYAISKSGEEHEFDGINDDLWVIYTVLKTQHSLNNLELKKKLSCFKYPDKETVEYREARGLIAAEELNRGLIKREEVHFPNRPLTESEISGEYKDQFIFLKVGETYEQEESLIGFYLLGGNYQFLLSGDSLYDSLVNMDGQRMKLPKHVNGYQLYDRDFLTNAVEIRIN